MSFPTPTHRVRRTFIWLVFWLGAVPLHASAQVPPPAGTKVTVPRVERAPTLEDFLDMQPPADLRDQMARLTGFTQRLPSDGSPVSQDTDAYLGYDDDNLYVVFVAFDSEPERLRARMTPREDFQGDDKVDLFLDTFHDKRRSYVFTCNPLGVQMDGRWTEDGSGGSFDRAFNALWESRGKITEQGYVVWMAIPFQSLRFPAKAEQEWGVVMIRWIPRNNESSTWPWVTTRIDGRLNQGATLLGLNNISPGRSIQLVPFGFLRSFRAIDGRDPERVRFNNETLDADAGLDAKFVFKDSFVLDLAVNPDFSQVESDEPQITINRRFEVFFPERRPFFLENSDFFRTPVNLFFSRRIADPQLGLRLTGKQGAYSIGALVADDQAPGRAVLPEDPLGGKRARFGVLRVNRDFLREATLGVILTDREFEGSHNRVAGIDTRFKLNPNWVGSLQAATSSTTFLDGTTSAGPAYFAELRREGRQLNLRTEYADFSPGFRTDAGFLRRTDIRSLGHQFSYRFRPEGETLISWGPAVSVARVWDHSGTRLDWEVRPSFNWELNRQTSFEVFANPGRERLRPQDIDGLLKTLDFSRSSQGVQFRSQYIPQVNVTAEYSVGKEINLVPVAGRLPSSADSSRGQIGLTLRPNAHLRNTNTYILARLSDIGTGSSIFNNHIFRSRWNWQFNRELAVRVILQYDTVLANPAFTSLETRRNFNADVLFTYLINPWTALYAGYNGNLQNVDLISTAAGTRLGRTPDLLHDSRQVFVKLSYLFQF